MGQWRYSSAAFDLDTSQLHVPAALTPWKEPPVPSGYEVGWTPEPVQTLWRSENLPQGTEPGPFC
jgi:hypothetical protein